MLLRRFCLKKSVNKTILFSAIFFLLCATIVLADEIQKEERPLKGTIDRPLTDSGTKIGRLSIENGFERLFFYTLYQIGGKTYTRGGVSYYHFPISELKFPLDVYMFYADLNLNLLNRLTIHYGAHVNINTQVGKMKDSDWVPYQKIKTIYSESDARLNAVFTEADISVRLFSVSFFSLKFGAGFMHQYMYYRCSNVEQISAYDTASPIYIGRPDYKKILGKVITYKLNYYMFTLQVTPIFRIPLGIGMLEIAAAIRFSPYLKARDIDDHILRGKISKNESSGAAFMPYLKMSFTFLNNIFITTKLEYLYLAAKGEQNQYYYNPFFDSSANNIPGWSAKIQCKLRSEQLAISLGAGYSFEF